MSDEYVSELSAIATVTVLRREIAEKDKRIAELVLEIASLRENTQYLPGYHLHENVVATNQEEQ